MAVKEESKLFSQAIDLYSNYKMLLGNIPTIIPTKNKVLFDLDLISNLSQTKFKSIKSKNSAF